MTTKNIPIYRIAYREYDDNGCGSTVQDEDYPFRLDKAAVQSEVDELNAKWDAECRRVFEWRVSDWEKRKAEHEAKYGQAMKTYPFTEAKPQWKDYEPKYLVFEQELAPSEDGPLAFNVQSPEVVERSCGLL